MRLPYWFLGRWFSQDIPPGQLDLQVPPDVDFDELAQPHVLRKREPLDQFLIGSVREINYAPQVQRSQFVAIDRMLNVKERLSFACSKQVPVLVEEFRCPDESGTLPHGVKEDLFEDQPVL